MGAGSTFGGFARGCDICQGNGTSLQVVQRGESRAACVEFGCGLAPATPVSERCGAGGSFPKGPGRKNTRCMAGFSGNVSQRSRLPDSFSGGLQLRENDRARVSRASPREPLRSGELLRDAEARGRLGQISPASAVNYFEAEICRPTPPA